MGIRNFILLFFGVFLTSCQIEGPISEPVKHSGGFVSQGELESFSIAVSRGVVDGTSYSVFPQILVRIDGTFSRPLYISYSVDNGNPEVFGPIDTGAQKIFNIGGGVYLVGEHTVSGYVFYTEEPDGGQVKVASFSDSFEVFSKEFPVKTEYQVSILSGSREIYLSSTNVGNITAEFPCFLKVSFPESGSGIVRITNINYTYSLLDFDFARKEEREGTATIPMVVKGVGDAFITVTFSFNGKTYRPTFQILIVS